MHKPRYELIFTFRCPLCKRVIGADTMPYFIGAIKTHMTREHAYFSKEQVKEMLYSTGIEDLL